ncbi:MAG: hypothetical protein IID37_00300 [Planctomycetes bacterium]|nr:hypothetical protein [Planctomycetota bacterium]
MARILVVHSDRSARKLLERHATRHHDVTLTTNIAQGLLSLSKVRPDLIVVGLDAKKKEALELLRQLKYAKTDVPTIVVGAAGAGALQPVAMKLGAAAFIEYPVEQHTFDQAVSKALQQDKDVHGAIPPITEEELQSNISEVESTFNRQMKCFAGKNQVYLQALIHGYNRTTRPRISLKCNLRRQYGQPPNVYYEYIRDVCCDDPGACPAYQEFRARNSA